MKKNKFSIGRLFYNDKFVMIFSVLVSIILWFTVSATNTSTESHKVISDITVTIELSQNCLLYTSIPSCTTIKDIIFAGV